MLHSLAETAAAHPELDGLTVAAIWDVSGTFYVYKPADSRVDFLLHQSDAQAIPAVQDGAIAPITGDQLIAPMSPPTALSLTWGLADYAEIISEAAANVS